jgi:hypothetical protein
MNINRSRLSTLFLPLVLFLVFPVLAHAANPFVGDWALTIPGGGAGWLGVEEENGKLSARIMWGAGSVLPVDSVRVEGNTLVLTRTEEQRRGRSANESVVQTITATVDGDELKLTTSKKRGSFPAFEAASFSGKRQPPMPPAPDLSKVKFGEPIKLFNGRDLSGWRLTDPHADSAWSVKDGVLTRNPAPVPGKHYGNLRTDREFEDFNITLETNLPKGGNSGVYLRGMYEVQVADTYGRKVDPHNMGAVYSRIAPSESAEKPAGEWQTLDITFVDRHVTVILNGKKIIDNQPIRGCTGGALWSDVTRPGPIYLQGDHTGVNYRNIVLRPVVKEQ